MNDTTVTVVGNVVDAPRRTNTQNGAVTNFRIASTARRYDSATEQYVDAGTLWIDVECWNALSGNVAASISKGDPVIVHGALTTHSWESDAGPRSKDRIKAFAVGPNLQKGRSLFTRDRAGRAPDESAAAQPGPDAPDFPGPDVEPRAGRDYVDAGDALDSVDAADLTAQPAHA
ncbi:single-stranded DNA-binding protein [Blastococcus sp. TML/M2B]|uniref:single-stranded DNA-binding protein n=1 Tax=unclassified Blastococcus TaxID=2619396 RepID=UPI00190A4A47|nr:MULTISPECIES: single-stranded DNA-binding protein [unclassified Blastococcus]MBN1092021.1 single-stranded DNA-binding protein [Blastococcus sp. TML/M2B]MBN1097878.1 single-stranded DNA-binding protein [Blastococcus sp. TML/C7B]